MTQLCIRSALFTPGNQPQLMRKVPRFAPDIAILDLEDAVVNAPEAKAQAREDTRAGAEWLFKHAPQQQVYLRLNPLHSGYFADDLKIVAELKSGLKGVVLPKVEESADLAGLDAALGSIGAGHLNVIAGIETVAGVEYLSEILAGGYPPEAVYFGAEDYVADLGGIRTGESLEVLYPRSKVAAQARLAGIPALDIVCTQLHNDAAFRDEAEFARALGYRGKLCVHPLQVALAHAAFTPSAAEIARARALLNAYAAASAEGQGVIAFDGQMVDAPMLASARAVLHAAGEPA